MSDSSERPMSPLGKQLLDSMGKDRPSPDGRRRAALALGLAAVGVPVPAGGAPAPTVPPAPLVHPYLMWAAGAVATVAIATIVYVRATAPAMPRPAIVQPVLVTPPAPAFAPAPVVEGPAAEAPSLPVPPRLTPKRTHRAAVAAAPTPVVPAPTAAASNPPVAAGLSSLSVETTLLDAARGALRQHASHAALELLGRYDDEAPAGVLRAEADALRIEATLEAGDRDEATRLGARFFSTHHDNALAARVRALLAK